jgi:hypothetical protein
MNSKDRVTMSLNHQEPDMVPFDMGGSAVTGMAVSTVYKLRQALKLDKPGTPVKVIEPYQMLGEIAPDLMDKLGVDIVMLRSKKTLFGFKTEGWKPWTTFDGTPVLVPEGFNTVPDTNGDILIYPEGDKSVPPSGRMPKDGYYFDSINRQKPIDYDNLNVKDNIEEFGLISDEDLKHFSDETTRLSKTNKAIFANFGGTGFGDIALVPAMWLKNPKGIRDVEEWYIATAANRSYVYEIFDKQCEFALQNLAKIYTEVGNKISVLFVTGTDFGTQTGPFISPDAYRELFQPFHKRINDWVHEHTEWKVFMHSCGSIFKLIPDFINSGFDILNPIQCSANNMDPKELKTKFGDKLTFWGGGVDTQRTLPFGTPDQVSKEVKERVKIFGPGGGFIFNPIHNVQAMVPIENLLAMLESLGQIRKYPVK